MPVLTPEQTFGFGAVPLTSYFKAPKQGSADTRFAPQARALLQENEAYQQQQAEVEADALVNELLGQAGGLSDAQINQTIMQNPGMFRSRDLGAVTGFQQFRQQATTPADVQLGQYYFTKLREDKDPRALQNFQRRMLQEGMSANDAWEEYRKDQFNEPLMQQLAEAGVPREEFDNYRTPTGTFDPVEVSRRVATAEAAKSRSSRVDDPLDDELNLLTKAVERADKEIQDASVRGVGGKDLELLKARRDSYNQRLQKATDEKLLKLRPSDQAPAPSAVGAAPKPSSYLQTLLEVQKIPVKGTE